MNGLLEALLDPQFRSDVGRGLLDAGNRGAVAGLLGSPVDLATMALRPLGYSVEAPVGGSEWIGQKIQNAGIVSPQRNALAEALASFAGPMGVQQAGPKLLAAEQAMARNLAAPSPLNAGTRRQAGAIMDIPAPKWNRGRQSIPVADWTENANPVMSEIRELLRDEQAKSAYNTLRTLRNAKTGQVQYAWPADAALHQDVGAYLGLRPSDWTQGIIAP